MLEYMSRNLVASEFKIEALAAKSWVRYAAANLV